MTEQEQRIAIAEACGYRRSDIPEYGPLPYWHNPAGEYIGGGSWLPIPDYLGDLNAMHEVEKTLSPEQQSRFCDALAPRRSFTH